MKKTYKKPNQIRAFFVMMKYFFLAQTRNPATFAFGFLFPVVFISIFGLIGNSSLKLNVGVPETGNINNPVIRTMSNQSFITLKKAPVDSLNKQLQQGKISGIIAVQAVSTNPPKYTVKITTSQANPSEASALNSFVSGVIDQTNLKLSGVNNPPITLSQGEIAGRKQRYIDFALPGQIGFSLLSTAVFGTVFGLIFLKKSLVLKRMFASPTKAITILLAQGGSRLIMALLQTLLIIVLGIVVFKFYLPHGWLTFFELIFLSILGLGAFLGFGYFMAGMVNDENSAGPLVNLITLPQFLLSGTFFPTDNLPIWLQPIANNLPLSYFNQAIRHITTEGGSLIETWPYMLGLIAWGLVMYILAAKTFKWE